MVLIRATGERILAFYLRLVEYDIWFDLFLLRYIFIRFMFYDIVNKHVLRR